MHERSYRKLVRAEGPWGRENLKYQDEEQRKWRRKLDDAYDNLSDDEKNAIGKRWNDLTTEQKAQKLYDIGKSVSI